ncbi:MAG: hypothetical protein NVSMB49_29040 [Ktedonobacteraceae bacterium]
MSQQAVPSEPRGSVRLRLASLGILSGLLVGVLMGIAARIAMRLVALVVDQGLEFTVAGTLGIMVVVSVASVLLSLIFVAVRRYLPGAGLLKGLAFSGLVFLFIGLPFLVGLLGPPDEVSVGPPLLGRSFFGALFLIYGLLVEMIFEQLLSLTARWRARMLLVAALLAVLSLIGLFLLGVFLSSH